MRVRTRACAHACVCVRVRCAVCARAHCAYACVVRAHALCVRIPSHVRALMGGGLVQLPARARMQKCAFTHVCAAALAMPAPLPPCWGAPADVRVLLVRVLLVRAAGAKETMGFRYFWMSDSCPQTVEQVKDKEPFEVLTLADPIAAALQI